MAGWHHRCNRHEFEQTLGDSEGQGSLVCCSPWGHEKLDMTERLNNDNHRPVDQVYFVFGCIFLKNFKSSFYIRLVVLR